MRFSHRVWRPRCYSLSRVDGRGSDHTRENENEGAGRGLGVILRSSGMVAGRPLQTAVRNQPYEQMAACLEARRDSVTPAVQAQECQKRAGCKIKGNWKNDATAKKHMPKRAVLMGGHRRVHLQQMSKPYDSH